MYETHASERWRIRPQLAPSQPNTEDSRKASNGVRLNLRPNESHDRQDGRHLRQLPQEDGTIIVNSLDQSKRVEYQDAKSISILPDRRGILWIDCLLQSA
jgi:hypothetical protein